MCKVEAKRGGTEAAEEAAEQRLMVVSDAVHRQNPGMSSSAGF